MTVPQQAVRDPRTAPGLVVPVAGPIRHARRRAVKLAGFALLGAGALALLVALPWLGMGPGVAAEQPGLVEVRHPLLFAIGGVVAVACAAVVIWRTRRS
ncbi:hypothetical protein [Catenuloplanes atrovinosus]|uniref:Uncharacterized protein n=1 Tax=Catenuloplanes atrovinosus TaxID=137266 RepID=A0AAE3YM97_9ACTN|nr:hypothetical protein [Catenuloplanes atrovinosus]MDR7274921.1 hypothetical protein [Catenuloplanes atrovinosus]